MGCVSRCMFVAAIGGDDKVTLDLPQWRGRPYSECTWERYDEFPHDNFRDADQAAIDAFRRGYVAS